MSTIGDLLRASLRLPASAAFAEIAAGEHAVAVFRIAAPNRDSHPLRCTALALRRSEERQRFTAFGDYRNSAVIICYCHGARSRRVTGIIAGVEFDADRPGITSCQRIALGHAAKTRVPAPCADLITSDPPELFTRWRMLAMPKRRLKLFFSHPSDISNPLPLSSTMS